MSVKTEKKNPTPSGVIITSEPNELSPQRRRVRFFCGEEQITEQSHKDDCDINLIIERFDGDELAALQKKQPALYGDFSNAPDYQESLDIVRNANDQFAGLPSKVRKEFDNDPYKFLAFASDAANAERMVDLGLAVKRPIIDPPASKGDIENLSKVLSPSKSGSRSKGQPTGGPKDEDDT